MLRERLKELRKAAGISQEGLAAVLGLERSSVGKYESAKANVTPSPETLVKMADYFGVTVDYLLDRGGIDPAILGKPSASNVGRSDDMTGAAMPAADWQTVQPQAEPLTGQEKQLLDAFRGVDDEGRMRIIQTTMNIRDEVEKKTSRTSDPAVV